VRLRRVIAWIAIVLTPAFATTSAWAQLGRPSPGGGDPPQRSGRGPADARAPGERLAMNQLEIAIEELREDLKLTPPQQPAWDRYVDKVRAIADDATRDGDRSRRERDMTGVQRIDAAVDLARNRYTALEDAGDAAKALYKTLTPEQQKVGDQRLANVILLASQSGAMLGMPSGGMTRERPTRGPQ
jgi:hypothetical protein